jgi:hypothetical protein
MTVKTEKSNHTNKSRISNKDKAVNEGTKEWSSHLEAPVEFWPNGLLDDFFKIKNP